jgi:hypothetical protein
MRVRDARVSVLYILAHTVFSTREDQMPLLGYRKGNDNRTILGKKPMPDCSATARTDGEIKLPSGATRMQEDV